MGWFGTVFAKSLLESRVLAYVAAISFALYVFIRYWLMPLGWGVVRA
jgi:hypothetical protein